MAKENTNDQIKDKTKKKSDYTAEDIYVLEGLDPVRQRPGMYIGSTGIDGLHHLIWEVVDNSLDEAMGGHCDLIEVILQKDGSVKCTDNGRGIPVETHKKTGKSALETVMTTLHAGGKFGSGAYKVSGGLHGVGVSVVCALSKYMKSEICRDGFKWVQEFAFGKPKAKIKKLEACKETGTAQIFIPDETIFKTGIVFDKKKVIRHLRQQAYLTPGVKINIRDEREVPVFDYNFYFEGGIKSYVKYLLGDAEPKHDNVFYCQNEREDVLVEVALVYAKEEIECVEESFANNINTGEGGMHLTGFRTALTRVINDYARKNGYLKEKEENLTGNDVREGLVSIVSIKIKEPQFEGQTKAKLGNTEAKTAVESVFAEAFTEFLEKNPSDSRGIIESCMLSARARKAAKAARTTVLRKGVLDGMALPGKLADCSSKAPEDSELYLVEGDSAGGSSKMARDRRFQAILPLRGKVLNVERARLDKILANNEIKNLVIALGAAIAQDFDIEKTRYHRIIIMSDADVDGSHIRTLLLTLFYRYFKPLIERGYLYIAQPPLYKIQAGKCQEYAYTEEDKDEIVLDIDKNKAQKAKEKPLKKEIEEKTLEEGQGESLLEGEAVEGEVKRTGVNVQRYKGLGEMNPEELWETTMSPSNRILLQVNIEDAKQADQMFDILMGKEVLPRKKFIQAHAKKVKNLDI